MNKDRKRRNPRRDRLFVETPESLSWLDTASMPMFATVVRITLFAKLLMMSRDLLFDFDHTTWTNGVRDKDEWQGKFDGNTCSYEVRDDGFYLFEQHNYVWVKWFDWNQASSTELPKEYSLSP
ncbi:hypothetical protein CTI12_AA159560 [Artemisia annua]|uniref:S-protein homolog n=1 Tax=Artemisia annua TaxID=35608 RepID=A0A2U1NCK4_ARTAN|nr:hypothetical protein CTI12_AA159560 [Artemisia annua]